MASNVPPPPPGFEAVGMVPPPPEGFEPAPVSEIDRFKQMLATGQLKPANATKGGIGPQFQKGLVQGAGGAISFPSVVGEFLGSKATQGLDYMLGLEPMQGELPRSPFDPRAVGEAISNSTGIGEAQTSPEKFANTIGQFLPGLLMGRPVPGAAAPAMAPMARATVASAVASEGAGQASEGQSYEPYARIGGALLGGGGASMAEQFLRKPPEGLTRASAALLRSVAPKDASSLRSLGPEGMALDAGPSMTGVAQGVAVTPGQNADDIINAVTARDATRSTRLQQGAREAFGRSRDPSLRKEVVMNAAQRKAGPIYRDAIENAPQLPNSLEQILGKTVEATIAPLSEGRRMGMMKLYTQLEDALYPSANGPDPSLTASRIMDMRKDLDSKIVYDKQAFSNLSSADKAMQGIYKDMRGTVDDIAKNRIPGIAEGDAYYRQGKKAEAAIDYGYDLLDGGKTAKSPEAMRVDISRNKLPERFVREGATARIGNAMGTQANDISALKKMLGGDNGWNREKLVGLYGPEAVNKALGTVDAESLMAQNYADITRNSQTARRAAAARLVDKPDAPNFTSQDTPTGLALRGGAKVINKMTELVTRGMSESNKTALTKALLKKGPEAIQLIEALNTLPTSVAGSLARALIVSANGTRNSQTSPSSR